MAKILVMDDDARNLRLVVTVLAQAGHEAALAALAMNGDVVQSAVPSLAYTIDV